MQERDTRIPGSWLSLWLRAQIHYSTSWLVLSSSEMTNTWIVSSTNPLLDNQHRPDPQDPIRVTLTVLRFKLRGFVLNKALSVPGQFKMIITKKKHFSSVCSRLRRVLSFWNVLTRHILVYLGLNKGLSEWEDSGKIFSFTETVTELNLKGQLWLKGLDDVKKETSLVSHIQKYPGIQAQHSCLTTYVMKFISYLTFCPSGL